MRVRTAVMPGAVSLVYDALLPAPNIEGRGTRRVEAVLGVRRPSRRRTATLSPGVSGGGGHAASLPMRIMPT